VSRTTRQKGHRPRSWRCGPNGVNACPASLRYDPSHGANESQPFVPRTGFRCGSAEFGGPAGSFSFHNPYYRTSYGEGRGGDSAARPPLDPAVLGSRWSSPGARIAAGPVASAPCTASSACATRSTASTTRTSRTCRPRSSRRARSRPPTPRAGRSSSSSASRELKTHLRLAQLASARRVAVEALIYAALIGLAVSRSIWRRRPPHRGCGTSPVDAKLGSAVTDGVIRGDFP
jgi:hypothetical protein